MDKIIDQLINYLIKMEEFIKKYLEENGREYITITSETDLKIIYDLYCNSQVAQSTDLSSQVLCYYGVYYSIKKNIVEMEKYYMMAIENGDSTAMCNLGYFYHYREPNYEKMIKYYQMAIDLGDSHAMYILAKYYMDKNQFDYAEKYYKMSIEKGNDDAMNNLAFCYKLNKQYDEAKKYFLMAIEKGNPVAMNNFGSYYLQKKQYDDAEKYLKMAIEKGNADAIDNLALSYQQNGKWNDAIEYFLQILKSAHQNPTLVGDFMNNIKNNLKKFLEEDVAKNKMLDIYLKNYSEIEELRSTNLSLAAENTHLKYVPGGIGYVEAKNHFMDVQQNKI